MHQLFSEDVWGTFGMTKVSIGSETYPQTWNVLFLLQLAPVSPTKKPITTSLEPASVPTHLKNGTETALTSIIANWS